MSFGPTVEDTLVLRAVEEAIKAEDEQTNADLKQVLADLGIEVAYQNGRYRGILVDGALRIDRHPEFGELK